MSDLQQTGSITQKIILQQRSKKIKEFHDAVTLEQKNYYLIAIKTLDELIAALKSNRGWNE